MLLSSRTLESITDAEPVFAALGDKTRLRLVSRLCIEGPLSIRRLTDDSEVTRQAVTKHLLALSRAGVARSARRGRETIWEVVPSRLDQARNYLDAISSQWDAAIGRLKAFVEDE